MSDYKPCPVCGNTVTCKNEQGDNMRGSIRCPKCQWSGVASKHRVKEAAMGAIPIQPTVSTVAPVSDVPRTGPAAIAHALGTLDLDTLEKENRDIVRANKKSKRPNAVKLLNIVEGLRRNEFQPSDLLVSRVPVIPPAFRPFSVVGDTFVAGDANELYADLIKLRRSYSEEANEFGHENATESRLAVYDAVKALYGYGDPVDPKSKQRGVSGFLKKITGCHDDQTEILTEVGWILFKHLKPDVKVATMNPHTQAFEWQVPSQLHEYYYEGEMFAFNLPTRVDALVTPAHNMWVKNRGRAKPTEEVTEESMRSDWNMEPAYKTAAKTGRKWLQTSCISWNGSYEQPVGLNCNPEDLAALAGIYAAEGWLKRDKVVQLVQCPDSNPDVCDEIDALVVSLGFKFTREILSQPPSGFNPYYHRQIRWSIRNEKLAKWLLLNIGKGSKNKFISKTLKDWPSELLKIMFTWYLMGDGTKRLGDKPSRLGLTHRFRDSFTDNFVGFVTSSRALFDSFAEVGVKLGLTIYERHGKDSYHTDDLINASIIGRWNTITEGDRAASIQNYKGKVYCATVTNGLLVTRRNTHILISGNSNPKLSFFQSKLLGKPQDSVARGVITVDPDLTLDEIGVPEEMAWKMYAPYIQKRLVRTGMRPSQALADVRDRSPHALKALQAEVAARPVIYSRAPSWHKYNILSGRPKLIPGSTIKINPLVTTGLNADFDGDMQVAYIQLLRRKS